MTKQELAARLLASFLDELDEQVRVLNAAVLALEGNHPAGDGVRGLFRVAHTLKGAARAANVPLVEQVCHELETLLAAARGHSVTLGPDDFALLFAAADALDDAGRCLRRGERLDGSPLAALAADLAAGTRPSHRLGGRTEEEFRTAPSEPGAAHGETTGVAAVASEPSPDPTGGSSAPATAAPGATTAAEASVRVPAEKLDALIASVGTLAQSRGQAAAQASDAAGLEAELTRLLSRWRRRSAQLRRRGDASVLQEALALLSETEQALERICRHTSHLSATAARHEQVIAQAEDNVTGRVRALRMRPFADVTELLPRVVRDVAAAVGKDVRLALRGTDVEADRAVLDGLREPLVHLVRNAVDHGVEAPEARVARGKSGQGTVTVSAVLRGDRLVVTVADDGAGVDEAALRHELRRAGRPVAAGRAAVASALLEGGITTRREASAISGRGVGLDVVRSAIERLGGTLDVDWTPATGTRFTLDCPIMLARLRAVLVAVGSQTLAVPAAHVDRVVRVRRDTLRRVGGREVLLLHEGGDAGAPVPLTSLARLLGPPLAGRPAEEWLTAVVVTGAGGRLAVATDDLLGEQEIVVRPLPRGYGVAPTVAGATVLPAGGVALVLNALTLVRAGLETAGDALPAFDPNAAAGRARQRILVADDSITTRALEQSVLEAAGYDVVTAHDGAEALRLLDDGEFDLVVSDVEMPRMDGFALCEGIRRSPRHATLPVILVTAKEEPEHRTRGLEAGADAYVGKSGFDHQDLVRVVRELLG